MFSQKSRLIMLYSILISITLVFIPIITSWQNTPNNYIYTLATPVAPSNVNVYFSAMFQGSDRQLAFQNRYNHQNKEAIFGLSQLYITWIIF